MKNLICICCPQGCHLSVDENNDYKVTGNTCERGAEYGRTECMAPVRVLTSTVSIEGGTIGRCPVKTKAAISKDKIFEAEAEVRKVKIKAPVRIGDVIIENVCGSGADVVATKDVPEI